MADITSFSPSNNGTVAIDGSNYTVQNANKSYSVTEPDSNTLRFQVQAGDFWNGSQRSEIAGNTIYAPGTQINLSYDFMVEPGPVDDATGPGKFTVLGQMHEDSPTGSPPFAVELVNGDHMAIDIGTSSPDYLYTDPNPIVRGQTYSMQIEAKFENDSGGFLEVWRDGVQIVNYHGPIGNGVGTYWKEGVYRSTSSQTMAVDYSNLQTTTGAASAPPVSTGSGSTGSGSASGGSSSGGTTGTGTGTSSGSGSVTDPSGGTSGSGSSASGGSSSAGSTTGTGTGTSSGSGSVTDPTGGTTGSGSSASGGSSSAGGTTGTGTGTSSGSGSVTDPTGGASTSNGGHHHHGGSGTTGTGTGASSGSGTVTDPTGGTTGSGSSASGGSSSTGGTTGTGTGTSSGSGTVTDPTGGTTGSGSSASGGSSSAGGTTGTGTGTSSGSGTVTDPTGGTTGSGSSASGGSSSTGGTTGTGTGTSSGSGTVTDPTGGTTGSGSSTSSGGHHHHWGSGTTGTGTGTSSSGGTTVGTGASGGATTPTAPAVTIANPSLSVSPGQGVDLGVSVNVPNATDNVTVNIKGLPGYETITDKLDNKTFSGSNVTLTAAEVNSGLTLDSSYKGNGHPTSTLTVTATDQTNSSSSAAQSIAVTDPSSTSATGTSGSGSTGSGSTASSGSSSHGGWSGHRWGGGGHHSDVSQWFDSHPGFAKTAKTLSDAFTSKSGASSAAGSSTNNTANAGDKAYALFNQMMAGDFGNTSHFTQGGSSSAQNHQQTSNLLTRPLH